MEEETTEKTLGGLFKEGFQLYDKIESGVLPFNSVEFQKDVKRCIQIFEDSTRLVNSVGMFSPNEMFEEIPTENVKYLLLPYFLGQLNTKCLSHDRAEALEVGQVYYKDFLQRCEDYGINKSSERSDNTVSQTNSGGCINSVQNLMQMANQRNAKIEQYRQKKELEEQIGELKKVVELEKVDDEIKRDFYLKFIKHSIIQSKEELVSIEQELQILQLRKSHENEKKSQMDEHENGPSHSHSGREVGRRPGYLQTKPREPLKPIIITRDAAQKAVFGAGYPSLPVMTVNDFYEQRVRDGIFPNEEQVAKMNERMLNPEDPEEKEEREKVEKELLEEKDDPEYLERQRAMDEFHDEVRRGDGNRHNRS